MTLGVVYIEDGESSLIMVTATHEGFKAVFAPPKGGKLRDVPLPGPVADALRVHMKRYLPVDITLPWRVAGGPLVTRRLVFAGPMGGHVWRSSFNLDAWKPALAAAGVIPVPAKGKEHASAREHGMHALHRFYASVLLDAGESVKAVAEYLGHSDPGLTLRVYAHLMPTSQKRTRRAVAEIYYCAPPDRGANDQACRGSAANLRVAPSQFEGATVTFCGWRSHKLMLAPLLFDCRS